MNTKHNSIGNISFAPGLAVALAVAAWLSGTVRAADHDKTAHDTMQMQMQPITSMSARSAVTTPCFAPQSDPALVP